MTTRKKTPPPPTVPRGPSDYERGVLDTLAMLDKALADISAAEHQVRSMSHGASPELRALLAGTNASANVAGHLANVVHKQAAQAFSTALVEARARARETADAAQGKGDWS